LQLDVLLYPSSRLIVSSISGRGVEQLTGSQTDGLCLLIDMIEYPGISNTEVRDNLEWFPDGQLGPLGK
jgi:hypothetical protein